MATSPSIKNYTIPTGSATFQRDGDSDVRNLGNIVSFSISNDITKKEHFRSYGGRRTKDKTIITQVAATITFTMDEITGENLAIFALGEVTTNTDGSFTIPGLSSTQFEGVLTITGDNDEGTQVDWTGSVSFVPSGDFSFIQDNDDFNVIAVEAEVQADDDGNFGVWTVREQEDDSE